MKTDDNIVSFDAEAVRLHGYAFAIGGVVLDRNAAVIDTFAARCPILGDVDPWVTENVLPALTHMPESHGSVRDMRDAFWAWLMRHKTENSIVVADCGWPVETGLLSACVADDPERAFQGPYPLHEVATMLAACGKDPMASYEDLLMPSHGHSKHDPVYDAHLSALIAWTARATLVVTGERSDMASTWGLAVEAARQSAST